MNDLYRFDGRVALVTGAGSGVGKRHAQALARLGAKVVVNDIRSKPGSTAEEGTAQLLAEELQAEGHIVEFDGGDIGNEDYATGLVERTVERFGRIDVLINNAGKNAIGTAQDTDTALLQDALKVNLLGSFWTMRTALQHMREQNYGRVVNTSSALGAFGGPNVFGYITAKAAVMGMSKGAAIDNKDKDIRINVLCPVALTPMSRDWFAQRSLIEQDLLAPERVSPVALYLAHEQCTLTGEVLSAGAGKWARIFTAKSSGLETTSTDLAAVFSELDTIMDVSEFDILSSSDQQYSTDKVAKADATSQ